MTDEEVQQLIEEFRPPMHVQRHCRAVTKFAVKLGSRLVANGEKLDLNLLRHAALLHDLMRVVDFRTFTPEDFPDPASAADVELWENLREKWKGVHHAEAAAQILAERGFGRVAEVVRKHQYLQIKKGFDIWEEKLLYYADKRTKHDQLVSLQERLQDGRNRNLPETENTPEAQAMDAKVFALEQEIFTKIGPA